MDSRIIDMFLQVISFANNTFAQILSATGAHGFWLAAILTYFSFKYFLRPLFGSVGSDLAKNSYNAFKKRKGDS